MVQCQCLKETGQQCTRHASKKPDKNPNFCWQHQNCQQRINVSREQRQKLKPNQQKMEQQKPKIKKQKKEKQKMEQE